MNNSEQLVRTCIACNIEKPLAAFLQITGTQGTVYGNICAACRGTSSKQKKSEEVDEEGSGASGLKIDSKQKVKSEQDKRTLVKEAKETDELAMSEDELLEKNKDERKEIKAQAEKFHRRTYLDKKQPPRFLSYRDKKQLGEKKPAAFSQDQEKRFLNEKQQIDETKVEEAFVRELKIANIDLNATYISPQAEIRYFAIYQRYQNWLGSNAPIVKKFEQLFNKQIQSGLHKPAPGEKTGNQDNNSAANYAEKTWNPTRRR